MIDGIYFLDLLGTFGFAAFGAFEGIRKKLDLFGILFAAFITAVGGGTLRELLLNNAPFYFFDINYLLAIIAAMAFTIVAYNRFHVIRKYMLMIDALGLSTFAFIGAAKAAEAGFGTAAITIIAVTSAVGGGLLRDVTLNETPLVLYRDIYAVPAIMLGLVYGLLRGYHENIWFTLSLLAGVFFIRAYAIQKNLQLWVPWGMPSKH